MEKAVNKGPINDKGAVAGTQPSGFQGPLCMFTLPSPFDCAAGKGREERTLQAERSLKGVKGGETEKGGNELL